MSYFSKRLSREAVDRAVGEFAEFPSDALIEVSNGCNHSCVFCNNATMLRKVGLLDFDTYQNFVKEAVPLGLQEIGLYATGEPFIVKDLPKYIAFAKEAGVSRVYITTNGALANVKTVIECIKNGLDSIKFSVNAATPESYKLIHGSDDFKRVLENIIAIDQYRKKTSSNLQLLGSCVLTKQTLSEKSLHYATFGHYLDDIIYVQAQSQGGLNSDVAYLVSPSLTKRDLKTVEPCWMLWKRLHLTCDGLLTCCCVDYDYDLAYYDYQNNLGTLEEAWNSEIIKKVRLKHLTRDLAELPCYNCLTGENCSYSALDTSLKSRAQFMSEELAASRKNELLKRVEALSLKLTD